MVVVAGRPNVGKSSLVNRLVGHRVTVVEEQPGVTRDRKVLHAEWSGVHFDVVDTGGWLPGGDELEAKVSDQAGRALRDADLVLFVVDVAVGVSDEDLSAARFVQRLGRPVLLVANKVDDDVRERAIWEFASLGLGDPHPVSAIHGRGSGDLLDAIIDRLGAPEDAGHAAHGTDDGALEEAADGAGGAVQGEGPHEVPGTLRVALIGRPNVGKSTLFNALIGEDRSIVHDQPGTTRDAVDTVVVTDQGPICFVDTAGMRRRARTDPGVETYAVVRSLEALDRADLALLVIDATIGATAQDQRLAERIAAAGCPSVVVVNKWDLVGTEERVEVLATIGDRLAFLGDAPVLRVAAKLRRGVHKVLPALWAAADSYHRRIPTGPLNRAVHDLQSRQPAPGARIRYAVQGAIDPPTFTLFTSGRLPAPYLRYLERGLRERFDLGHTPLKLRVRIG
jgi:GTP-binding protein